MLKKVIALLLCFVMISLCGCSISGNSSQPDIVLKESSDTVSSEPEKLAVNPLTGLDISASAVSSRPVAVMINNINVAQSVQTGINKADIVYETEVEGGITRLLAVFKDISAVNQLGTVRSARYPYVDLALGHDAVYIHCGQDPTYCAPHLKDIDDISISEGECGGQRINNGLSSEHTLYTFGNKLLDGIKSKKIRTTVQNTTPWQEFSSDELTLGGGACNSVTVPFSTSYKTMFDYDAQSQKYTRSFNGTVRTDYITKEKIQFKNIFVLMTTISDYPKTDPNKPPCRKVALDGGNGYYISNGTYTEINWTKGNAVNEIKFTDKSGAVLKINKGNSWICLADSRTSNPIIK